MAISRGCRAGLALLCLVGPAAAAAAVESAAVQLGPRPYYLVDRLRPGPLRDHLSACAEAARPLRPSRFSIGHRGAPLQFPEHTVESYRAAARMGAGLIECDVTFTADGSLVCRHAQCDLHSSTDILLTPLARRCTQGFEPARYDTAGRLLAPARARCCASDLSLAEFRSLRGRMDGVDPRATSVEAYLRGTPDYRTDLYATGGTLLTHAEAIGLLRQLGVGHIPELKAVTDGFADTGLSQAQLARRLVREYIAAGIPPEDVHLQSFNLDDLRLWLREFPAFGAGAVLLDGFRSRFGAGDPPLAALQVLKNEGVNIIAPPMPALLRVEAAGRLTASSYARRARAAGLALMSWSVERSGRILEDVRAGGNGGYFQSTLQALDGDGGILETIDALARQAGVIGLFSDWPATTSFYANCTARPADRR